MRILLAAIASGVSILLLACGADGTPTGVPGLTPTATITPLPATSTAPPTATTPPATASPTPTSPPPTLTATPRPEPSPTDAGSNLEISSNIIDFGLDSLEVRVGTTVTWTQRGNFPHTVTSGESGETSGLWDSGTMGTGQTFSFTFDEKGTFPHFCQIHPSSMVGTITVVEGQASSSTGTSTSSSGSEVNY